MARIIRTTVDEAGNVELDFTGFTGDECVKEEEKLRKELAMLGLALKPTRQLRNDQGIPTSVRARSQLEG